MSQHSFQIERLKMHEKVGRQRNPDIPFTDKMFLPLDSTKKDSGLDIKLHLYIYHHSMSRDWEVSEPHAILEAEVTFPKTKRSERIIEMVQCCKCSVKITVQVVDPLAPVIPHSHYKINKVSGSNTLEKHSNTLTVMVDKVLSHNQITHGRNQYFQFNVTAELTYTDRLRVRPVPDSEEWDEIESEDM